MKPRRRRNLLVLAALVLTALLAASLQWRTTAPSGDSRSSLGAFGLAGTNSSSRCTAQARLRAEQLLQECPGLPGYCRRHAAAPARSEQQQELPRYLAAAGPAFPALAAQASSVEAFLRGAGFQARVKQLQALPDRRGILISAGKPHHVGNAAIVLHVLRHHLHCRLPVEIAHRGDKEIDAVTRQALSAAFPPLHFLDLDNVTYPRHHNPSFKLDRYEPKIFALYNCRFWQLCATRGLPVLLLDADSLPLRDPSHLFDAPHMSRHGVMAWLDLWSPQLSSTTFVGHKSVWRLLGIHREPYWEVLSAGQGYMQRVAESGQLVFDRVRHADVLEHLWLLTSYSSELYKHVLGDKVPLLLLVSAPG